jgi:hypothetical protein
LMYTVSVGDPDPRAGVPRLPGVPSRRKTIPRLLR